MTKEEAKNNAEVMMAYAQGKTIEVLCDDGEWGETDCPSFDFLHEKYRVKEEQIYRPFKDSDECFNKIKKHKPNGWVQFICDTDSYYLITSIENEMVRLEDYEMDFEDAFEKFLFADGTPFGIKE